MRKIILTILLSLLTIVGYSQTTHTIDKLFVFKLGMSIQQLGQIVDTSLLEEVEVADYRNLDILTLGSNLGGKVKVYFLAEYEVQPYYVLRNIHLSFFDNKLLALQISEYNKKTEDLLTEKYSMPKISKSETQLLKIWYDKQIDSPTTAIMSSKIQTVFGTEQYGLELVDLKMQRHVSNLAIEELSKQAIKDNDEKLKDRL